MGKRFWQRGGVTAVSETLMVQQIRAEHDARVTGLINANNRYLEDARAARAEIVRLARVPTFIRNTGIDPTDANSLGFALETMQKELALSRARLGMAV